MKKQGVYIGGSDVPNLPPWMLNEAVHVSGQSTPAILKGLKDSVLRDGLGSYAGKAVQKPLPKALANIAGSTFMLVPGFVSTPLAVVNVFKNISKHFK